MAEFALNPRKLAIFVQSGDSARLRQAVSIVASAAALDWEVVAVFMGEALAQLVEGFPEAPGGPAGATASTGTIASARQEWRTGSLLQSAVDFGRVSLLACTGDAQLSGYSRERLLEVLDDVVAMPTILVRIRDAGTKLYV